MNSIRGARIYSTHIHTYVHTYVHTYQVPRLGCPDSKAYAVIGEPVDLLSEDFHCWRSFFFRPCAARSRPRRKPGWEMAMGPAQLYIETTLLGGIRLACVLLLYVQVGRFETDLAGVVEYTAFSVFLR